MTSEGGASKRDRVRELLKKALKPGPAEEAGAVDVDGLANQIGELCVSLSA